MSSYDPQRHHRRSIRMKGYDYTQPGAYFVTVVAYGRQIIFGDVIDGVLQLNEFGFLVETEWRRLWQRFDWVVTDEIIVMPNHVHGILFIVYHDTVGAGQKNSDQSGESSLAPPLQNSPGSLGAIIRAYKSTTTRLINGLRHTPGVPVWQRNYYEHIVRDEKEMDAIRQYIQNNPAQWELDQENPLAN